MKIGKSVRMSIRERLAQRLRRGPLPEVLAAQTRAGLGPIAPFRDLRDGRVDFSPAAPDIEPLKRDLLENLRLSILAARGEGVDADALGEIRARIADFHA